MDEAKLARLRERAHHLTAVRDFPSWQAVKAVADDKREKTIAVLCDTSMDDRELHRLRGFISGLAYLVEVVENGEQAFQRALQSVERLQREEHD